MSRVRRGGGVVQGEQEEAPGSEGDGRAGAGAGRDPVGLCRADLSPHDMEKRRRIRSLYVALHSKITDERDDLTNFSSDKFTSIIRQVEDLHKEVVKTREQVADAEALLDITSTLVSSVKSQSNEGITVGEFVSCLVTRFGESGRRRENEQNPQVPLKWKEIGLAVSHVFRQCNGFNTMMGPMNTELKQRKAAVHRKRTGPTARTRPEEVDDGEVEEKTDTDKNMSTMFDILRRKKRARLETLILNRRSFSQTVENLFALSFLVKDGRAEISVDSKNSHFVSPRNAPAAASVMSRDVTYRHFVFRFDFKDWKLMMDAVPDGEELMPHRENLASSQVESATNDTQPAQPRTPIRKLSRNRGLVLHEECIVEDSPETAGEGAKRTAAFRRCKRKLT